MKKTLIALVALAGLATATEYVTTNSAGTATGGFEAKGFAIRLDGTAFTTTSSDSNYTLPEQVILEEITLNLRVSSGWAKDGVLSLVITDTSFNVIAWSNELSAGAGEFTWTFGSDTTPVTLNTSKDYLILADSSTSFTPGAQLIKNNKIINFSSTGVMDYTDGKVDYDGSTAGSYSGLQFITVADPGDNNPYTSYNYVSTANNNPFDQFVPNISIVTKSIPEPTTATLSLLALAGLAARRRRK